MNQYLSYFYNLPVIVKSYVGDYLFGIFETFEIFENEIKTFGWKRPLCRPPRILKYRLLYESFDDDLPEIVDLTPFCPPIFDQGKLGSCTANAICMALEFDEKKQNEPFVEKSRLFLYYNERAKENHIESDDGASIADGIKIVYDIGVCEEKYC